MTQPQREWVDPFEGFEFQPAAVTLAAVDQIEKLEICGLDSDTFAGDADPSFFIGMGIRAGIRNGISAEGNVNMLQRIVLHRPVRLDEPLVVKGRIARVNSVPRGRTVESDVWFEGGDGDAAISVPRTSLKPDPAKVGTRGAGERPPPIVADPAELDVLSEHRLTPDIVRAYSTEGNSIHYEMEAANKAGFRAPLIGGGMGVHYLLAALWAHQRPQSFAANIYFRRPIFWDEQFSVVASPNFRAMALIREGKVLTEIGFDALTPAGGTA